MTVVLTGATGGLGSQVLKALLTLVSPETIRISTRDPSKLAPDIQSSGVKTFKGDFSYPESLLEPFKDAEALLLVSYPSIAHEERVRMHVGAIDAAKKAGVKHVFYTSLAFEPSGGAAVFAAHRDTEAYLKKSGLTYTIIREGIYSESYPLYFGFFEPGSAQQDVYVPGDGGIAWVNREDLGYGTAMLMADKTSYQNQTVLLSGSRAVTLSEVASLISPILARPVKLHVISEDEWITRNKKDDGDFRHSEEFLQLWATTYPALAAGECATVDPLLEKLLGRPPRAFEKDLKDTLLAVKEGKGALEQYAK